jgi:hypothetical protein
MWGCVVGGFFDQFDRLRARANQRHGDNLAATFLCGDFNIKAGSEGYQAVVRTGEYEDQYLAATERSIFENIFRKNSANIDRQLAKDGRIDFILAKEQLVRGPSPELSLDECGGISIAAVVGEPDDEFGHSVALNIGANLIEFCRRSGSPTRLSSVQLPIA